MHFTYLVISAKLILSFYFFSILTEHSRDGFLCSAMFGASPGKTQMTRDGNYLEALYSHGWCLDCDDLKAEFS